MMTDLITDLTTGLTADTWRTALLRMGVRPAVADEWAPVFADTMPGAGLGPRATAHFVAQALHESAMLTVLAENLNYSADRLVAVWPRRFPTADRARPYARNPEGLANYVYGGRMGNTEPGDGWRYRGRGLIQITGRSNYELAQELTGLPVVSDPDLLLEPGPALLSALAWWGESVPDAEGATVEQVTRRVNGGINGLADRRRLFGLASRALEAGA